ncbi:hypothetical protein FC83_GL001010 [Agrilactobacillus composti DSM 18527 = JCM 14202]|uniref:Uncharacterized protein n=1 Tax=Agrilactobacillus composti DSM 18527 = JCM 14202 TaxID=1423734 RepID=X0PSV5_9LACO|nr:DUF6483 family protein [Agrilactobacillus composti]KRM35485.1 hypothetical protein FC83_GL001010 [Agrilactobacillus composti DSM 18527 = JCM 14202]GAF41012.1 hypothetical protein JCM14202_2929 [Agrilactobacillus composti DSM 18527 = JCM 14202]
MQNESDWIMRQIHAFADGLGYILASGKGGGTTEIVFPEHQAQKLPQQTELQRLVTAKEYGTAAKRLWALQYALPGIEFIKLAVWLFDTLRQYDDSTLVQGDYSRKALVADLQKLKRYQGQA